MNPMNRSIRIALAYLAVVIFMWVGASANAADDHLTVQLRTGCSYTAPVDSRTDQGKLWLRFEGRSVQLLRPIEWNAIVRASFRGKEIPLPSLNRIAQALKNDQSIVDHMTSWTPRGESHAEAARRILALNTTPE